MTGLLVLLLLCATALAHPHALWAARSAHLSALAARPGFAPTQLFTQRLTHFDELDQRTWSQRYWLNDTTFQSGGPIYLQIGGEGSASPAYVSALAMSFYAQATNALQVALEHRFYGESRPFPTLDTANLRFLTSQEALADLVHFVESHVRQAYPSAGKLVVFGGSYPGALASFARTKYPTVVDYAVSTSSPVLAVLDMVQYLEVVDDSLAKNGGPQCDAQVRKAFAVVDQMLQSQSGCDQLSQMFNTCTPIDVTSPKDIATFLSLLIGNFMGTVQYDHEIPGALDIKTLCDSMLNPNKSPLENLVATTALYGPQCAAVSYAAQLAQLRNASDFGVGVGIRQWTWQTCNEFGFFQSTDAPPAKQPFGVGVPLDYYTQLCLDVFGASDRGPHTAFTNQHYGGKSGAAAVGGVLYANNDLDPWKSLSVTRNQTAAVRAIVTPNAAHCANMNYPPQSSALAFTQQFIARHLMAL